MMRRFILLIASGSLLLAACSSAASTPPAPPTDRPATATPASTTASAPSSSVGAVAQAKVTFDGEACRYLGPLVVPSDTRMTIDFQVATSASAQATMVVGPMRDGTTAAEVKKVDTDWPPSKGQPPFMLPRTGFNWAAKVGPGSITVDLDALTNSHAYLVTCIDFELDKARAAGMIQVLPG